MLILKKALGFLRLYRFDVFVRYIFLYLLGCYGAVGFSFDFAYSFLVSLLISGISFNFIYSLNSWFDADIDAINKPHRTIPSGLVSRHQALVYALILLSLSVLYPFALFGLSTLTLCFLWFPVAGVLYSNPVFSFKKNKYFTLLLITTTVFLVPLLGYFLNGGAVTPVFIVFSGIFVVGCIAAVPLKDISDVTGDIAGGADNWFKNGVRYKRFVFSGALLVTSVCCALYVGNTVIAGLTALNLTYFVLLCMLFWFFDIDVRRFYTYLSGGVLLDTVLFLAWYAFVYAGFFV